MPIETPICDAIIRGCVNSLGETVSEKFEEALDFVWNCFWETSTGQEFLKTYVPDESSFDRITTEYTRRFGTAGDYGKHLPGLILSDRLVIVVGDLMRVKDPALTLAHPPQAAQKSVPLTEEQEHRAKINKLNAMKVDPNVSLIELKNLRESSVEWQRAWNDAGLPQFNAGYVAPAAEAGPSPELKRFSHLVNEAVQTAGIGSIKPRAGVVTLQVGGKGYQYNHQEFEAQYEQAASFGLIR